jgi:hypothetical protein
VKFGPVLALAEEMEQAIRSCWHGRGELPDVVVSLAPSASSMLREEMLFVATQLQKRMGGLPAVAPALGRWYEPGNETGEVTDLISALSGCAGPCGMAVPASIADASGARVLDATDAGRLAALGALAKVEPAAFRAWLDAAREVFPIARSGWPISISEEDVRFLPQVEDAALAATFLESVMGRQLLLCTWPQVSASPLGLKLRAL